MTELGKLLRELEEAADAGAKLRPVISEQTDNQLIQVRLGTAASLFTALKCKHAATAGHALRVALTCSAWALKMGLQQQQRDAVEVAALLHDVGVIGVPDHILLKPGLLDSDEAAVMARTRRMGLEILAQSCACPDVLGIVGHVPAWYDGTRGGFQLRGADLPLGARMIAVAEAFDAMTTDHVYRPAMSHERAMTELFDCAGGQFDPDLVREFAEFHVSNPSEFQRGVAERWLQSLDPEQAQSFWKLKDPPGAKSEPGADSLFHSKLLDNMYDAVVFIDTTGRVTLWNRGAERLTGISGTSVCQRQWKPDLLSMSDEKGHPVADADCPVNCAIRSGVQSLRRLTIFGRSGRPVAVDSHAIPVVAGDGTSLGAILLFHDASSETSLERRCQNLHEKATKDSLTQVANRAEFDRVHEIFVATHQHQQVPCSLMICDLDRFKQVNDTYGHQAGDDVIRSLAALLKNSCLPGDLVARYGGEEFVMLCADCDNATAARRAETVRLALSKLPQAKMGGRFTTVSFGVTEVQPGDTPATMLRRADRALLTAKARGRNNVVQLGTGPGTEDTKEKRSFWSRKKTRPKQILEQVLVTPVPIKMAIEKLRGFVADHQANIVNIDSERVRLEIVDKNPSRLRRLTDRPVTFQMDVRLEEERFQETEAEPSSAGVSHTKIYLSIGIDSTRNRRSNETSTRARQYLISFKSYLMAGEESAAATSGRLSTAKRILTPWLINR